VKKPLLLTAMVVTLALLAFAQTDNPVPAFNSGPPSKTDHLPEILSKDLRAGESFQSAYHVHAYELA